MQNRPTRLRSVRARRPAPHNPTAPAIDARDLAVAYGERFGLRDVTFSLAAGRRLAVIGPNGAGKSTFLKVAGGLLSATSGTLLVHGHAPRDHLCVAYVPQRSAVDWRFPLRVADVVLTGRTGRLGALRWPGRKDRELSHDAMERVGLGQLADRLIGELSGGEQQRMFIARAMAQEAEIVLLDEPLAGLDVPATSEVMSLLRELRQATLVVALHDLSIAAASFDRVLLLRERMIQFGTPSDVFRPEFLELAYGGCVKLVETETGRLVVHDDACAKGGS